MTQDQQGKTGEGQTDKQAKQQDAQQADAAAERARAAAGEGQPKTAAQDSEADLERAPQWQPVYPGSGRLAGKVALITGADSGIGRAVAALYAREGADVAIVHLSNIADAEETQRIVAAEGQRAIIETGDIGDPDFCNAAVARCVEELGGLDVLVNNAGEQHPAAEINDISADQLERTFRTNIFAMFYLVQAALPHLGQGSAIINCTSVTMYKGSAELLDYSATKGAITAFTRSLSANLVKRGIRVNAVAPGPIWTPLNPRGGATGEKVEKFGESTPMQRPGEPNEVAPSFLFLACADSSYMTGQVLHPNGGTIVNG